MVQYNQVVQTLVDLDHGKKGMIPPPQQQVFANIFMNNLCIFMSRFFYERNLRRKTHLLNTVN